MGLRTESHTGLPLSFDRAGFRWSCKKKKLRKISKIRLQGRPWQSASHDLS